VDPRTTLFDIASLTKIVATTTAVAQLVEDGTISLNDRVSRFVPDFRGDRKDGVTIRQLLTHASGIPSGLWLYGSAASAAEALEQVLEQPLRRPPAEAVEYSDLGMILLAHLVERVSDSPLDQFLAQRLFVPLGMQSTMFLPPNAFHDRVVPTAATSERPYPIRGVVHDANSFRLGGLAGHAGLFSTAADLAAFAQMWLGRGRYGPVRVLADSTVDAFTRRQPAAEERALGWDTPAEQSSAGRYFSASSYGHTGFTGTSIWIDPVRDLFVVLLTNRTYSETSPARILDLRVAVHEAVARAVTDQAVRARLGARR
jgi:CubicO group peptidase (beta-lactamase class C family)